MNISMNTVKAINTAANMMDAFAYIFGDEEFTRAEAQEVFDDILFFMGLNVDHRPIRKDYFIHGYTTKSTIAYEKAYNEYHNKKHSLEFNELGAFLDYVFVSRAEFINPRKDEEIIRYILNDTEIEEKVFNALPDFVKDMCEKVVSYEEAQTSYYAPKRYYYKAKFKCPCLGNSSRLKEKGDHIEEEIATLQNRLAAIRKAEKALH